MAERDDDRGITWHGRKPSPEHPPGATEQPLPQAPRDAPATPDASGITWHGRGGDAQPATTQPATTAPAAQQPAARTRDPNAPDPVGFIAGLGQGLADIPEAAGQMIQKGGEAMGVNPSRLVPGFVERGAQALRERAAASNAGKAGEVVTSLGAFALQPELGIEQAARAVPMIGRVLGPAARVFTRSTVPAVLQPTAPNDQDFWHTKALQGILGTGIGEALQGLSWAARTPLGNWAVQQAKAIADKAREDTAAARDQLARVMTGRTSQLSETAARTAARDTEEQARQRAYGAARTEYERQAQEAVTIAARNQARQQVVDRLNQRNTLDYAGRQAQAAAADVRRLDTPRQATQSLLNDARGLIGLRPLEYNLTRESAPQVLREVGGELDRIYGQMSFDPNQGGWLANAQRVQRDIAQRLRQDPRAQALWQEVFQDRAFMPGLRAEAGAGAPVRGVAPGTVRSPAGQSFAQRSLPTGEVQGPLGTRSGPVSGDQLARMMSTLTKAQQRFGLEAQRGGGAVYRDMAEGLARMRQSVESQLDARFPALAEQRRLANQAYFLTSRVMDKVDVHGVATPERLLQAFKDAEGDTRFGTDRRYADIKDRLEQQHRDFTADPDKPTAPTAMKGYDEPVPKVGKEPSPPEPVPPIQPVPLRVPKSTRVATPATRVDPRLPAAAEHLAGEAGRVASRATGIPLLGPAARGIARYGRPAITPVLRGTRDVTRTIAPPMSAATGQGVTAYAAQQAEEKRRADERRRRRQQQRSQ